MGAWAHGYFDNDGAQDVLSELSRGNGKQWGDVVSKALTEFGNFLDRDARGESFRPLRQDELDEQDRAVREALADLPHLIDQWAAGAQDEGEMLADIGDHEAQAAVAAAALIALKMGASFVKAPKKLSIPEDFDPTAKMVIDARGHLRAISAHPKLHAYVSQEWLGGVRRLLDFFSSNEL
jgi:hypothetical protein